MNKARPKVPFERLTALTDRNTRASEIYTGNRIPETCLQHRVPIHDNYSCAFMNLDNNDSFNDEAQLAASFIGRPWN